MVVYGWHGSHRSSQGVPLRLTGSPVSRLVLVLAISILYYSNYYYYYYYYYYYWCFRLSLLLPNDKP